MTYHPMSGAAFVYQDAAFAEVLAHDNGYVYGLLPFGHEHEGKWVRFPRERNCSEWQQRRLISEWDALSTQETPGDEVVN